jgi:thiamine biosynthesis lipoprotein
VNPAAIEPVLDAGFDAFFRTDALMDRQNPQSEVQLLNSRAGFEPTPVSPELFRALRISQAVAAQTDDAFDITAGPLSDLWGFPQRKHHLPSPPELQHALSLVGSRFLELFPNGSARFARQGMLLDLSPIATGCAIDAAAEAMASMGLGNFFIKAGSNVRAVGAPPGLPGWMVELENGSKPGGMESILLKDGAISTASRSDNFFLLNNKVYGHILDPKTGLPVENTASCSALAATALEASIWAQAFFVMGPDQAIPKFTARFPARWTLPPAGRSVDGKIKASPNFPNAI